MKKVLNLGVIILIAGITLFLLDYFSTDKSVEENTNYKGNNAAVIAMRKSCDTLAQRPWNKVGFKALTDKVAVYRDQKLIQTSEATSLEKYMMLSYARSMVISYENWVKDDCSGSFEDLEGAMRSIASQPDCGSALSGPLKIFGIYRQILTLPGKVGVIISNQYDESTYTNMLNTISSLTGTTSLQNCPAVVKIRNEQSTALQDFAKFVFDYNDARKFYDKGPNNYFYNKFLFQFCPHMNSSITKYAFYLNEIESLELCN
jgi:hypothetical protein